MVRGVSLVALGCTMLAGSAVLGPTGAAAQAARPGPPPASQARPVPGPTRGTGSPADPGQPCFNTFPNCTSADPAVAFTMNSAGDSTGCTFEQDTEWGDGSHTTVSYPGGTNGTALFTFQHAYGAPGIFQISWTISVQMQNSSSSCSGAIGSLQFTLPGSPVVSCQAAQFSIPVAPVPVKVPAPLPSTPLPTSPPLPRPSPSSPPPPASPLQLGYGPTPLSYPAGTTSGNALCTMRSTATVMPVTLNVRTRRRS